jgi:superoxide dismutase, Cu-Zn family
MKTRLLLATILALASAACGDENEPADPAAAKSASATLAPTMGNTATGTATFTTTESSIKLVVTIANAPPSTEHGFHIHANGACGVDGMEAGGHWDPTTMMHGRWTDAAHHSGDIGNIMVDASGNGSTELVANVWSIGTGAANDVVNHAVILHASPDDFVTQPTGNAGGRIACGVIQLSN